MTDGGHTKLAEKLRLTLDSDQLTNCMRCGFCQTACPTFRETGREAASPRGRIALMKAVQDGLMEPDSAFVRQMDLCLGCRACEPACPSGVKYGQLIEQAREAIAEAAPLPRKQRMLRRIFLKGVFPHPKRMRALGKLLRVYRRLGLRRAARAVGAMKRLPRHLREMEAVLPEASGDGIIRRWLREGLPARRETLPDGGRQLVVPAAGPPIGRAGLFRGCVMDVLFTATNLNTVRLLRQAGYEVVIPDGQTCCGALHSHAGDTGTARRLALSNILAFRDSGADFIATNAGGCGAMLKEYDHLLDGGPEREAAARFAGRVKDVTELLVSSPRPLQPLPAARKRAVTYQDSCHLRNVMRVAKEPRQLLCSLPGVELREMEGADRCCGSAGIYNITQPEMSAGILDHKMEQAEAARAEVIVTSNPGCLLQMQWGILQAGRTEAMRAVHLVDLLAESVKLDKEDACGPDRLSGSRT